MKSWYLIAAGFFWVTAMTSLTAAAPAEKEDADPPERSLDKMAMAFGAVEDESALTLAKSVLAANPKSDAATAVIKDLDGRKLRTMVKALWRI